jgi:hypothetical protein
MIVGKALTSSFWSDHEQTRSNAKVRVADDTGSKSGGLSDIFVLRSAQFLGESDEKPFTPAGIAEP